MNIRTITRGLDDIGLATIAADGTPGTAFTSVGFTDKDSPVQMVEADPTAHHIRDKATNAILHTMLEGGDTDLVFTIVDPDLDALALHLGGEVVTTEGVKTYNSPAEKLVHERTVRITPKVGHVITVNRGLCYAKINADYSLEGKLAVDVVVSVAKPKKTGVSPMAFTEKV